MYEISPEAQNVLLSPSRTIRPYGNIGEYRISESNVIDFGIERVLSNNGLPGIGGAIAAKLELTLVKQEIPLVANKPITVGIEVLVNGTYEKIPLGTFFPAINSIKKTEQTLKVDCFDRMTKYEEINYTTRLTYPAFVKHMCIELQEDFGVPFANLDTIPDDRVYYSTPMLNIRSILGEIAELLGANAIMNRHDEVEFVTLSKEPVLTITADNYIDLIYNSDEKVTLAKLSCTGALLPQKITVPDEDGEPIEGVELTFTNDAVENIEQLRRIYDTFMPLTYQPYEMKLQGMPHIDVGDKVTVIDKHGSPIDIFVINHKLQYHGGLISEWSNEAPDAEIVETGSTGSTAISDRLDEIEDSGESVIHFENRKDITIQNTFTEIVNVPLVLTGNTEAVLHFTAIIESLAPLTIFFEITNNNFLLSFQPLQTLIAGYNLVNFTLPLKQLDPTQNNRLSIRIRSDLEAASAFIKRQQAQIIVRGRNILDGSSKAPFTGGSVDAVINVEAVRHVINLTASMDIKTIMKKPFEIRVVIHEIMNVQNTHLSI